MRSLDLIPRRLLEWEPSSTCHEFITAGLTALGVGGASAGAAAAADAAIAGATAAGFAGAGTGASTALAAAAPAALGAGGTLASSLTLPSLSTVGTAALIGGTALQAKAGMDNAEYQASVAEAEAEAIKAKASQEAAAAQRQMQTRLRQADIVGSRARALAAASGTLATDPTEVDIEAGIAEQGRYNALSALFEGMAASQADRYQSEINLFRARRARAAAPWAAIGTGLPGVSTLAANRQRNYLLNTFGA